MTLRANPWLAELRPYQPGMPISELQRELGLSEVAKLASNENPFGPSPRAQEALARAASELHRYPDGACFALRRVLAERLRVAPGQLVFGAGSDEVIGMAAKCLLGPGDEVLYAWPSFAMYPLTAQSVGAVSVRVPLSAARVHDLSAMLAAVTERTRMVLLCNPNNPTGTSVGAADFDRFVEGLPARVVLVVDEAYVEYMRRPDRPQVLETLRARPGTCILRTFSKAYGLAGLRIGYGICDPELADLLERVRHPFNVNAPAVDAALAALEDTAHLEFVLAETARGMEQLESGLAALGVRTWPSDANFLLAQTGPDLYEGLLKLGVIVRPMAGFGYPDCIRVSVGTAEENEKFLKALQTLRENGAS